MFTAANWNVAQTVTVTGVDDAIVDGDVGYTIVTAAAVSADAAYNGLNAADVAVTNTDNDAAGITVAPTSGLMTTEAGGTATFTVVLNTQPTADVTIALSSSATRPRGRSSPASLIFTAANWNMAQTVTVTGVDDAVVDGDVAYTIVTAAATSSRRGLQRPQRGRRGGRPTPTTTRQNRPPTAADLSVTTAEDTPGAITLAGTDPEGGALTYIIVTGPAHGSISGSGAGRTYTPAPDFNGTDTFTYKVNDGTLDSNVATVSITVTAVNDPPVASNDNAATTDQAAATINVLANDTDPDLPDDTLKVVGVSGLPAGVGSLSFTDTTVTYTPAANTRGAVSFQYTVQDAAGATSTASVTVDVTDVTAPRVVDVRVRFGPGLSRSMSVNDVARNLPWINIQALDVIFSEDVDVTADDLRLAGVNVANYTGSFTYAPGTRTASLTLVNPLGVDRLMLLLDGDDASTDGVLGVRDGGGNFLAGGDYAKAMNVLPGDFDGDGVVTLNDAVGVRNGMAAFGGTYSIWADMDGDGDVDADDVKHVQRRIGFRQA